MGCGLHIVFIILHIAAVLLFFPALFITIPLHIVVAVMSKKNKD